MIDSYKNPFSLSNQWNGNQLGDPFLFRFNGYTYLYCSSRKAEVKCWKSENLTDWVYVGSVCSLPEIEGAYAPEICYYNGVFYMVTSPKGSGHYILSSESPEGPFVLVSENLGQLIDGSFFIDDDGKEFFLRAGHNGIVIHDMPSPSMVEPAGETIPESYMMHWTEGPMIIKRDNFYYLTYTGNHLLSRGYRVNYSVSETSAKKGYKNLRNNTLLLETGDEFHALGHSSSVLGPDMDSFFIAYHSFDFRPQKPFRSLNIDRLFFNKARMYTNATWWTQDAPVKPWFVSRDGHCLRLIESKDGAVYQTPDITEPFTAEICIVPDKKPVTISLAGTEVFVLSTETAPPHISLSATVTIRLSLTLNTQLTDGSASITIWLNNLLTAKHNHIFRPGPLTIYSLAGSVPSFVGISCIYGGSGDKTALKSIPGRFDAVHATNILNASTQDFHERGMKVQGIACNKDSKLTFAVNVKDSGRYLMFARVQANNFSASLNEEIFTATLPQARDSDGFAFIRCGDFFLQEGKSNLCIADFSSNVILDYVMFTPFHPLNEAELITDGENNSKALTILGHKNQHSMQRKYSGFTCAENHGMAFYGDTGYTDYTIKALLYITPATNGEASILFRITKESWFHAQSSSSFFGYRVKIDRCGLHLSRCAYDEANIGFIALNTGDSPKNIEVQISVVGNLIEIHAENQHLTFNDPEQFAHGKIGIEAKGEGYGFKSLSISNS